jgi:hypothetical protein
MPPSLEMVECTCSVIFGNAANRLPDYKVSKPRIHNMNLIRCENLIAYKLRPLLVVHRSKHYSSNSTDSTSVCETGSIRTVLLANNTVLH